VFLACLGGGAPGDHLGEQQAPHGGWRTSPAWRRSARAEWGVTRSQNRTNARTDAAAVELARNPGRIGSSMQSRKLCSSKLAGVSPKE
jgi:hypothetical protein